MTEGRYLDVKGHRPLRDRLVQAINARRLPQSLLFHGPRGIGKQRLAIWTAAAVNCSGEPTRPCGDCRSCRLAARLEHPDIHWFFPLPRPKRASTPEAMRQKLEDARVGVLSDRRENPLYIDDEDGATGIYVAAVHSMRRLAVKSPAMAGRKVLIVGRAEALVPQLGSPEAANALLKLLEEPPADTNLILTSDVPGALLPTIRSRVQAVRVPPLLQDDVVDFLITETDADTAEARRLTALAAGSIGRALELRDEDREGIQQSALELVKAVLDGRQYVRLAAAHGYSAFGARGAFLRVLAATRALLRDLLASAAGAAPADAETLASLQVTHPRDPADLIRALEAVDAASELASRNVNPQLIVVNLLRQGAATAN